jgi:hypothetical protein
LARDLKLLPSVRVRPHIEVLLERPLTLYSGNFFLETIKVTIGTCWYIYVLTRDPCIFGSFCRSRASLIKFFWDIQQICTYTHSGRGKPTSARKRIPVFTWEELVTPKGYYFLQILLSDILV